MTESFPPDPVARPVVTPATQRPAWIGGGIGALTGLLVGVGVLLVCGAPAIVLLALYAAIGGDGRDGSGWMGVVGFLLLVLAVGGFLVCTVGGALIGTLTGRRR